MSEPFDKVTENMDDSSSSDSDNERFVNPTARKKHLFGRTEPLHKVLGNGKCRIFF